MRRGLILLLTASPAWSQQAAPTPSKAAADLPRQAAVRRAEATASRALDWLLANQQADGSWGGSQSPMIYDRYWSNPETHRAWQLATTGLGLMALLAAQDSGAFLSSSTQRELPSAIDAAVDFLVGHHDIKRPSVWDTDNTWAYVYGLAACTRAARDERLMHGSRAVGIKAAGQSLLEALLAYQTPAGGWAYYDEEAKAVVPAWATSFQTGAAILAMLDAERLGWQVPKERLQIAVDALAHCRLPDGAYSYTVEAIPRQDVGIGIDRVRGSLSRMQVGNLALWQARQAGYRAPELGDEAARGLALLFREHHYLDIARGRPYPHEAYHYNSGYFYFFGHYYAGELLPMLPTAVAQRWAPALIQEVAKTQSDDGSMIDFFMNDYGRPYGVAFGLMALLQGRAVLMPADPATPPAAAEGAQGQR